MTKKRSRTGASATPHYNVPGLERGLLMLELLGDNQKGLSLVEVARRLKLPVNSTLRIASTLVRLGYVSRDEKSRRYVMTRRLMAVGCSTVHEYNIVEKAMEQLRRFRDEVKETVALAILLPAESQGLVLAQLSSAFQFGFRVEVGMRFDLHSTGPGKALLAFLPEEELKQVLSRMTLTRYNENTITNKAEFIKELERIRATGYAVDRAEALNGCYCVAVPVFDEHGYPIAAIWATGPSDRFVAANFPVVGKMAQGYAAKISEGLTLAS